MLLNCGVGEDSRVPWTARRSNQSILKEISPNYSLEGLTLKLKLQYSGRLLQRTDSLEKTLMLGKIEGRRRRGQQRMRWLDGITNSMDIRLGINSRSWWWTERPGMLQSMGSQRVSYDWDWTHLMVAKETWTIGGFKCPTLYLMSVGHVELVILLTSEKNCYRLYSTVTIVKNGSKFLVASPAIW